MNQGHTDWITFRIEPGLKQKFRDTCEREGLTYSKIARTWIRDFIQKMEGQENELDNKNK